MSTTSPVYFLPWNMRDQLPQFIYDQSLLSQFSKKQMIALKIHFGERGGNGHVKPASIKPIIKHLLKQKTRPFLTDTNTIYSGPRKDALGHLYVAAQHGYSLNRVQVPIIIADGLTGNDYISVDINKPHIASAMIGAGIAHSPAMIAISHFKGHVLGGFGGAIKNLGMGCASRQGKFQIHSNTPPNVHAANCSHCNQCISHCAHQALSFTEDLITLDRAACVGCGECVSHCPSDALSLLWSEDAMRVQEKYCEYAFAAIQNKTTFYFNFLNHITENCDCRGLKETPLCPDIGILASPDPVAIDQACFDMVCNQHGDIFKQVHPHTNPAHQLDYARQIGLGQCNYNLIPWSPK